MFLNSPAMNNIFLARHFDLPVCQIGDKHYIVARAHPRIPLGLILEITDIRRRLLGEFYVVDWEAELLELITPAKTFSKAVKALREDEVLDFEPAYSQLDAYTMALNATEKAIAQDIRDAEALAAIADEFYGKCVAAEALDIRMLNDTLPALCAAHNIQLPNDRSLEGWRKPSVSITLLLAQELIETRKNA